MKILLLFELSSFHVNLRDGLRELGHDVQLIANEDRVKQIEADLTLALDSKSAVKKIYERLKILRRSFRHDVVQLVNPNSVFETRALGVAFLKAVKLFSGGKLFSAIALENPDTWKYFREGKYKLSPHTGSLVDLERNGEVNINEDEKFIKSYDSILKVLDGIIPTAYEYHLPFAHHPLNKGAIPFPINTSRFSYKENKIRNGKVHFFHGVQSKRKEFKGSSFILKAMEEIKSLYPNDVEMTIATDLPFASYLEKMSGANVVLDQVNSHSPAMNALIAMSMGRMALTGAEKEYLDFWGYKDVPFKNISSSVDDIKNKMLWCLENKNHLEQLGADSRKFVVEHHNHIKIAGHYVKEWQA